MIKSNPNTPYIGTHASAVSKRPSKYEKACQELHLEATIIDEVSYILDFLVYD